MRQASKRGIIDHHYKIIRAAQTRLFERNSAVIQKADLEGIILEEKKDINESSSNSKNSIDRIGSKPSEDRIKSKNSEVET